jgi:RNA polymerase sigma factor (sigma-70 family)
MEKCILFTFPLMKIELDLITACIRRERKAEYELYSLSYSYLLSICFRYVNSLEEAKQLLNIGFMKILFNLDKYKPEIPFKTWARKVMINVLIDEYRKEKKHHDVIRYVEEYEDTTDGSDLNEALIKMNVDEIHAMITSLPNVSRKVFNLYALDGYSHKEIAELLNMSEGTSKWHLNFSRNKLKEMIKKFIPPLKKVV